MESLNALILLVAVLAPLVGAIGLVRSLSFARTRGVAVLASAASFLASLAVLWRVMAGTATVDFAWLHADLLAAIPMSLFSGLALAVLVAGPQRELGAGLPRRILILQSATLLLYAADNLGLVLLGWVVSGAVWTRDHRAPAETNDKLPPIALGTSSLFAAIAVGIAAYANFSAGLSNPFAISSLALLDAHVGFWVLAALMLAVILRKGIFPFQTWLSSAFDGGPLLLTVLLVNTHAGAYVVARLALPLLPQVGLQALPILSVLALFTAAYTALVALAETNPRRLMALLSASQASFILAGLESARVEGRAGAMAQWIVVAVATTGLVAVYSAVEARINARFDSSRYLGLAPRMPRLAVFFVIFGLALVGLPGTFGFCAEDLLFHGTMESRPLLGVILPLATALNAVHVFRLFARLFLGSHGTEFAGVPDALPRERVALLAAVVLLVWTGLAPGPVMNRIAEATAWMAPQGAAAAAVSEPVSPLGRYASQTEPVR